jgi:integrase/recombinase XerD
MESRITAKTHLELEDVEAIEKAATCLRDRLLIRILSRVGCRISEALGLTLEDIDFGNGTVRIEHLKVRLELACPNCGARLGKSHFFCNRCGKAVGDVVSQAREHRRMRSLPVDHETLGLLRGYVDRGGVVDVGGRKLIFGINRHRGFQIVRDCAERAGLSMLLNPESGKLHHVSPHRFRDFLAIQAMKADDSGDGLRLLQQHLGHSSFNTTARYRKIGGEEHRSWYDKR